MERRDFIRSLVGGVIGAAAVRTFPFRVFSFPEKIKIAEPLVLTRLDILYGWSRLYPRTEIIVRTPSRWDRTKKPPQFAKYLHDAADSIRKSEAPDYSLIITA